MHLLVISEIIPPQRGLEFKRICLICIASYTECEYTECERTLYFFLTLWPIYCKRGYFRDGGICENVRQTWVLFSRYPSDFHSGLLKVLFSRGVIFARTTLSRKTRKLYYPHAKISKFTVCLKLHYSKRKKKYFVIGSKLFYYLSEAFWCLVNLLIYTFHLIQNHEEEAEKINNYRYFVLNWNSKHRKLFNFD